MEKLHIHASKENLVPSAPFVRTVRGDIRPESLGITHTHEHLIIDITDHPPADATEEFLRCDQGPLRLDTYYYARRHKTSNHSQLSSIDDAVEEIARYRAAGGRSIVDATPRGLGRDPAALVAISQRSDVQVVMGAGYYVVDYHPPAVAGMSTSQIAQEIIGDIIDGVDGVRAGIIGEIGMSWPVHPDEMKVLDAAVIAQRETGAALLLHPGRNEDAPRELLARVRSSGGDLHRTVMSHVDRTLFSDGALFEIAETGCYIEFDLFGQESSHYEFAPIDMPNDATRVDYIVSLRDRGYLDQVLVAQDICHQTHLHKYGGEGYSHILEHVVPLMHRKGLTPEQVSTITTSNPAAILTIGT